MLRNVSRDRNLQPPKAEMCVCVWAILKLMSHMYLFCLGTDAETPKFKDYKGIMKHKVPKKSDEESWKQFAEEVLILIHTVNHNEYWAAVNCMKPPEGETRCVRYKGKLVLGTFGGCKAALVQTRMGSRCQDEIESALQDLLKAQAVVAVGVAYASDSRKCEYADVLISTHIEDPGDPKVIEGIRILNRGEKIEINRELHDTFCYQKETWVRFERTESSSNAKYSKACSGIILSAPWLVDSAEYKAKLLQMAPEAIGGEMEGFVLLQVQKKLRDQARHIGVIVIKGVADYADGSKRNEWQLTAAMAAADFACYQLENNGYKPRK